MTTLFIMMYRQHSYSSKHLFCCYQVLGTLLGFGDTTMIKIWAVLGNFKVLSGRHGYKWAETKQCNNLNGISWEHTGENNKHFPGVGSAKASVHNQILWLLENKELTKVDSMLKIAFILPEKNRTVSGWQIAPCLFLPSEMEILQVTVNSFPCSPTSAPIPCGRRK